MLDWLQVILDVQLHEMHKYINRALPSCRAATAESLPMHIMSFFILLLWPTQPKAASNPARGRGPNFQGQV
jgi:hypothetical protein